MFISQGYKNNYYLFYIDSITGERKKVSCGTKSKKVAKIFKDTFIQNLQKETISLTNHTLKDVKEIILSYLKNNVRRGTLETYKYFFRTIEKLFPDKLLNSFSVQDIEHLKTIRLKDKSIETVNTDIKNLKRVFNILVELELIKSNPIAKVKNIKKPVKDVEIFTDFEVELLKENISKPLIKDIFSFAIESGLRLNELINLQIKDINFNEGYIQIRNKENFITKSGESRIIPLNDALINVANKHLNNGNNVIDLNYGETYLFLNEKGFKTNRDFVTHGFKKEIRKLNLSDKYKFHHTRHYFITKKSSEGIPLPIIMEIVGHKEAKTTAKYTHITKEHILKAFKKLS